MSPVPRGIAGGPGCGGEWDAGLWAPTRGMLPALPPPWAWCGCQDSPAPAAPPRVTAVPLALAPASLQPLCTHGPPTRDSPTHGVTQPHNTLFTYGSTQRASG